MTTLICELCCIGSKGVIYIVTLLLLTLERLIKTCQVAEVQLADRDVHRADVRRQPLVHGRLAPGPGNVGHF